MEGKTRVLFGDGWRRVTALQKLGCQGAFGMGALGRFRTRQVREEVPVLE